MDQTVQDLCCTFNQLLLLLCQLFILGGLDVLSQNEAPVTIENRVLRIEASVQYWLCWASTSEVKQWIACWRRFHGSKSKDLNS